MSPEAVTAVLTATGLLLLAVAGRMEHATLPATDPTEGVDDAEAVPAEDL